MVSPEGPPFAFFAWLAHVPSELAERIRSSLSADKRSPEGLGLDRIRSASYALTVPAKQKRVLNLSGTGNKLQVHVSLQNTFHRFLYLAVEPSFQPRDGKPICYEYQGCSVCNVYERCSGKPICCLSRGQVFFDLFSGVLPDSLMLSVCFFFFFLLCLVLSVMSGAILFPLSRHVLLPLGRCSGYILHWLSGYGL